MFAVAEVIRLMAPLRYLVDQTALGLKHPAPRLVIDRSFIAFHFPLKFSSLEMNHGLEAPNRCFRNLSPL